MAPIDELLLAAAAAASVDNGADATASARRSFSLLMRTKGAPTICRSTDIELLLLLLMLMLLQLLSADELHKIRLSL